MPWLPRRGGRLGDGDTLEAVEDALDDGDAPRALRIVDRVLRAGAAGRHGDDDHVAALVLRAQALHELGRFADALRVAASACEEDPEEPAAWGARGAAAYRRGDFGAAATYFRHVTELDPRDAEAWGSLGRALVWLDDSDARAAFRHAARLDPAAHVVPVRVSDTDFDRMARDAWESIPRAFTARLGNTLAVAELLPDREDVEEGLDPDVLGTYDGATALDDDGMFERVVVYQRNHENVCANARDLRAEVRRTILHEVGHHFGMDEHELPY